MRIGYCNPGYPVIRNILNKCPNVDYVRVRSIDGMFGSLLSKTPLCHSDTIMRYLENSFHGGFSNEKVDLYHFFNKTPTWPSRVPYITTFEAELPRKHPEGVIRDIAVRSMLSDRCKKLIAFSQATYDEQEERNIQLSLPELNDKMMVLLPPQEALVEKPKVERKKGGPIRFLFVGKDLFRKGGKESLKALAKIRKDANVELYLIGDYHHVDYMSSWDVDSADEMERLIAANKEWVHYEHSTTNNVVLELAKRSDVGLLPTRHDTFGYSVLEFQACGLPCVTTDVQALSEVNNNDCGWVIKASGGFGGGGATSSFRRDSERARARIWRHLRTTRVNRRKGIQSACAD